jgi:hypothetical protein
METTTATTPQKELVLDERRRTSFARLGHKDHSRYLVAEYADGTLVLTPAVTVSIQEIQLLQNPSFRKAMQEPFSKAVTRRPPRKRRVS